ncbi:hypothetical protein FQN54_001236 [Arachnomyces sp. PD_36]|nr:hypothetical protein FQN54_001236 [Arachnomyces sp. PD_36]
MPQETIQKARYDQIKHLMTTWGAVRKLPHGQVDDKTLRPLGILSSKVNIDDTKEGAGSELAFFKPFPARQFDALPAYTISHEYPEYRERKDRSDYSYERGCALMKFLFWDHLFHNQWETPPGSKFCLHMHSEWTQPEDPVRQEYGRTGGKAQGTEWLLIDIWEHLERTKPHAMGTLINDTESDDRLVLTELVVLIQLIIATTNMRRWAEHTVFPVLLVSILGKQQIRIIEGHFDGTNIIVRYSKLYDFREEKSAPVKFLLRWFLCTPTGNTKIKRG